MKLLLIPIAAAALLLSGCGELERLESQYLRTDSAACQKDLGSLKRSAAIGAEQGRGWRSAGISVDGGLGKLISGLRKLPGWLDEGERRERLRGVAETPRQLSRAADPRFRSLQPCLRQRPSA